MPTGQIHCTHCAALLPFAWESSWSRAVCPACKEGLQIHAFPALHRSLKIPAKGALPIEDGNAACFFHSRKAAVVPCDACGRFLCDLCDLQFQGGHFCATCLDAAQKGRKGPAEAAPFLKDRVFLPQNLVLGMTLYLPLTMVGLYTMPITAPAAIWIAVRNWNREEGMQVRGKGRYVLGITLALGQILATGLFVLLLVYVFRKAAAK
ncbi:MAG: hypothetical protein ABI036_11970 [Fibrobacteria bacterium]